MRESIKALNATFSAATVPYPLPDELRATIESFLERYDSIDDHDSQRFHEDLHALYLRHVAGSSEKQGAFLSALRLLRPAITGETRLTAWWDLVLKPTIDGIGHKRHEIEDAREIVQSILVYDVETDQDGERARLSNVFIKKVLDAYLAKTNVPSSADDTLSPENEFLSHELEAVLVAFGRKMPKVRLLFCTHNCRLTRTGASSRTRRPVCSEAISHSSAEFAKRFRPAPATASAPGTRNISCSAPGEVLAHRHLINRHRACPSRHHYAFASHMWRVDFRPPSAETVSCVY